MTRLERLQHLQPQLQQLKRCYGASKPGSDVDLLVDFPESPSFEQFMDLKLALEDLLCSRVDLVTRKGLRESLRAQIEAEAQVVA
jgi:uncharacterized protein